MQTPTTTSAQSNQNEVGKNEIATATQQVEALSNDVAWYSRWKDRADIASIVLAALVFTVAFFGNRLGAKLSRANREATAAKERLNNLQVEAIRATAARANEHSQQLQLRVEQEALKRVQAEERLERLRKKVAPRGITDLEPLEKGPKARAEILYQDDLPEAYRFACDLRLCLLSTGWEVPEPAPIPPDPARPHVPAATAAGATDTDVTIRARWLEDHTAKPEPDTAYTALHAFFSANGLGVHSQSDLSLPPDFFRIVIGPKW
jgi:hypothetical protein